MGVIKITKAGDNDVATIEVSSTISDVLRHAFVHTETDKTKAKTMLKNDLFNNTDFDFPVVVKLNSEKFKIEWDDNGVPNYTANPTVKSGGRRCTKRTKRSKRSKHTRRAKRRA
jgi:hypothetical protein